MANQSKIPLHDRTPAIAEILLAETAIRVELPPSWHQLAVERYEAIRSFIERPNSPLHETVTLFYPQGSMAIGATIRTRKRETGYDIDIVAELRLPPDTPPNEALHLLYTAIKGEPGSRYYDMVERQSRCVTVHYQDGMHLDVTPSILIDESDPRRSLIFHANPEKPQTDHHHLVANSYGFGEWFNANTPNDLDFAEAYRRRALARHNKITLDEAEAEPVPDHPKDQGGKSATVVGLQLLKRNRNVRYKSRHGQRMPPSVALSSIAGRVAQPGCTISEALERVSGAFLQELQAADQEGVLLDIRNPRCDEDQFTDRWPENFAAQRQYIEDLRQFRAQLRQLMEEGSLEDKSELLKQMFGEEPAATVVDQYARELTSSVSTGNRGVGRTGRILPASAACGAASSASAGSPGRHTFFGDDWQ